MSSYALPKSHQDVSEPADIAAAHSLTQFYSSWRSLLLRLTLRSLRSWYAPLTQCLNGVL